jgi:colanic acid/amylovoran biosynthesis glycosyltransferase
MQRPERAEGPSGRHIGYVLKRFPRISETFIASELIELERQGERITVFAVTRPDEPFRHAFLDELRAEVVYLPHRPLRDPARVARALLRVLRADPGGWLRAAAASVWPPGLARARRLLQATVLRDEMRAAGIDHAHAHFATAAAALVHLSGRMGGPPYSVTTHAKDIYHEDVEADRLRERLGPARFVATVSEDNRRHLDGVLRGRTPVHLVSNSVDLRRLGAPRERRPEPGLVLAVARMVEKKGLVDLVEACGLLARRGTPVRLEIVGDGPLRAEIEATARRRGAPLTLHGALPQEGVHELYRRAAVFSLPCVVARTGDRDGLPTSVLEAMALGVPVVTTAVNGLSEAVIDGGTGLHVPQHDPVALADALERLLGDDLLAARLSQAARRHVEQRFALERSAARLRTLFGAPEAA